MKEVETIHRPNQALIDHIKSLLAKAETGELQSMIEVAQWCDSGVSSGYVFGPQAWRKMMVGEMVILVNEIGFESTRHAEGE